MKTPMSDEKQQAASAEDSNQSASNTISFDSVADQLPSLDEEDVYVIVACLEEACAVYKHATSIIVSVQLVSL